MSSFKRRVSTKDAPPLTGTRALPGSVTTHITSTGVPSLDDILGGGLPLTCDLVILAPDAHSAYGELLQKYFIAQGLSSGQDVCVVDNFAREFVSECMRTPGGVSPAPTSSTEAAEEDEDGEGMESEAKIKIAWRYEQLKQFQTTVAGTPQGTDDFCKVFDLTSRILTTTIDTSISSGKLRFHDVSSSESSPSYPHTRTVLASIEKILGAGVPEGPTRTPMRVCVPSLGSLQWGDMQPHHICAFLHTLRAMLKRYSHAVAAVSLSPHMCSDSWGGPGWTQKLGWLSDTCISLSSFSVNLTLQAMFPTHHGFVHIHSLPAPHSLQPPSDKFSTLRGLTSSGENNLAFKCMRKRLVFETLHLDLEGGIGERRTTPSTTATVLDDHVHIQSQPTVQAQPGGEAALEVRLEKMEGKEKEPRIEESSYAAPKKTKPKKRVAFHSDRPDLYDF